MDFQALNTMAVAGKTVLLRADLNVPAENGVVTDTTRIDRLKPTIDYLTKNGAKTLILSHFGRPKGVTPEFSLKFLLPDLEKSWGVTVGFADDCIGASADAAKTALQNGQVTLLENVRFHPEEEKNDPIFSEKLAHFAEVYVNDAFGTAHRAEGTTYGIAQFAPIACAGPLLAAEIDAISKALANPKRPLVAIVAGSKVSTKLTILKSLARNVDQLIVGGGIANTFMLASGLPIGKSLVEADLLEEAKAVIEAMKARGAAVPIPVDVVTAKEFKADAKATVKLSKDVEADDLILDIGPQTAAQLSAQLKAAGTIVWNGPVGVFEFDAFSHGTEAIARAIAASPAFSIAGGGDTLAAIAKYGIEKDVGYISTGGGAFLEVLEGKTLPAFEILGRRAAG